MSKIKNIDDIAWALATSAVQVTKPVLAKILLTAKKVDEVGDKFSLNDAKSIEKEILKDYPEPKEANLKGVDN